MSPGPSAGTLVLENSAGCGIKKYMSRNTLIFLGIAGSLVVGGILVILIFQFDDEKQILPTGNNKEASEGRQQIASLLAGPNAVYAASQPPADSVVISQVVLERTGFVVIREEANGGPSQIVGASDLVHEGETTNVQVALPRETQEGEIFYAMLYEDNGNGIFDSTEDLALKDGQSKNISMKFQIDSNAKLPEEISL